MSISELYKRGVLCPWFISIIMVTTYSIIENRNYKSEWLTAESVVEMSIAAAIVYGLIISLLALSIFLNNREKIKSRAFLSALSWFLLPGGFVCVVLGKAINEYVIVGSKGDMIYALLLNLPFVFGLVWSFQKFRRLQFHHTRDTA